MRVQTQSGYPKQNFPSKFRPSIPNPKPRRFFSQVPVISPIQPLPETLARLQGQFQHHRYNLKANTAVVALALVALTSHFAIGLGVVGASFLWLPAAGVGVWLKVVKPRREKFVDFKPLMRDFSAAKRSIVAEILDVYHRFAVDLAHAKRALDNGGELAPLPGEFSLGTFGFRRSIDPMDTEFYEGSVSDYLNVWTTRLEAAMRDFEHFVTPDRSAKELFNFLQRKIALLDSYAVGLAELE